jgi:hypothetical protein
MPPKMDAVSISLVLPRREGRVMGGGGGPWQCGGMWRHMEGAWSSEGHVVEVVVRCMWSLMATGLNLSLSWHVRVAALGCGDSVGSSSSGVLWQLWGQLACRRLLSRAHVGWRQ